MVHSLGAIAAFFAYLFWGFLPIYWKAISVVPAYEILCHRVIWSLFFTFGLIVVTGRLRTFARILSDKRTAAIFTLSALLLSVNWLLFIWAVNSEKVIEASLGYFINPLIVVLFGVVFLKEKLRRGQCFAIAVAFCGVLYLTFSYGQFPWIALTLATTFALYGLVHKTTSLPAIEGLCLETMVLFIPAIVFLLFSELKGTAKFGHVSLNITLLLVSTGVITSLPLLLFGFAAHNISLTLLGLLQYTAPTINLLLGILLYSEPFPPERMIGFMFVWVALLIYIAEGVIMRNKQRKALAS